MTYEQGRVTKLRRLLNVAESSFEERSPLVQGIGPDAQRRLQLLEIRSLVSLYGLRPVLDAYLAKADVAAISSLCREQLQALTAQLRKAAERVEFACDERRAPPAR